MGVHRGPIDIFMGQITKTQRAGKVCIAALNICCRDKKVWLLLDTIRDDGQP